MRLFVGVPWWLAAIVGALILPVWIVGYAAWAAYEIVDEVLRGARA